MMGFIKKYILPEEVDFDRALQKQLAVGRDMTLDFYTACMEEKSAALDDIRRKGKTAREIKSENLKKLLNVLITQYDRESIYRMIINLDWIALSLKHLATDVEVYHASGLDQYRDVLDVLVAMPDMLQECLALLPKRDVAKISHILDHIHDSYDDVVEMCAHHGASRLRENDTRGYLVHLQILHQLKDLARRIHMAANSLEDMALKVM